MHTAPALHGGVRVVPLRHRQEESRDLPLNPVDALLQHLLSVRARLTESIAAQLTSWETTARIFLVARHAVPPGQVMLGQVSFNLRQI